MQPGDNVDDMTFEQALKRLEEIVQALEGQDITLEQSVALYKEGAVCGAVCRGKLDNARHELEIWQNGQAGPADWIDGSSANDADEAGGGECPF